MENLERQFEDRADRILKPYLWKNEKGEEKEATVRYATENDLDGLMSLDRDRAQYRLKRYNIKKDEKDIGKDLDENLKKSLEQQDQWAFIIMEADGKAVGYIEFGPDSEKGSDVIHVGTLSTIQMDDEYKGKGFGKELLEQMEEQAKEEFHGRSIELNTHSWNQDAIKFWEKNGFEGIGIVEEHKDKHGNPVKITDNETGKEYDSKMIRMRRDLYPESEQE